MRGLSIFLFLITALLLGMRHALDPDHLVAVSTLAAEERRLWPVARLGLVWGLGHFLALAAVGLPVLWLRLELPPRLEDTVDLGVGLVLVLLGLRTLWRFRRERVHLHVHTHGHGSHAHFHTHVHGAGHTHAHPMPGRERQGLITFATGMLHGLAGSGAAAVLALTAAPSVTGGIGYLLAFGAGTCAGMFAVSLFLAAPILRTASRFETLHGAIRVAAGLASLSLGGFMWWEIAPGLFR